MKMARGFLVVILVLTVLVTVLYPWIAKGLKIAYEGWRTDPVRMIIKLLVALIIGQGIGWFIGHDQIGLFMRPMLRMGAGQSLSQWIVCFLPITPLTGWIAKLLEIATDAVRIPLEALTFFRFGIVPDALATAVTSPLWPVIEVAEKVGGVAARYGEIGTRAQLELSTANIYGNLVRYIQNAFIWVLGYQILKVVDWLTLVIHRV